MRVTITYMFARRIITVQFPSYNSTFLFVEDFFLVVVVVLNLFVVVLRTGGAGAGDLTLKLSIVDCSQVSRVRSVRCDIDMAPLALRLVRRVVEYFARMVAVV